MGWWEDPNIKAIQTPQFDLPRNFLLYRAQGKSLISVPLFLHFFFFVSHSSRLFQAERLTHQSLSIHKRQCQSWLRTTTNPMTLHRTMCFTTLPWTTLLNRPPRARESKRSCNTPRTMSCITSWSCLPTTRPHTTRSTSNGFSSSSTHHCHPRSTMCRPMSRRRRRPRSSCISTMKQLCKRHLIYCLGIITSSSNSSIRFPR